MLCCLNPACHNPPNPDGTMFCSNCGVGLVVLRNRYRPIKSLGGGGFGKTYLAEDVDKLNEHCVIKQFAPQVQGTASLNKATELFEQEAKRLQQLGKHPQIPTLLAYFNEDNRLYLVQEFIEGQNLLAELQQQGTSNEQKIRELLLDLLDILQTVHQQKVIHRDIKPENIIRHSDGKLVLIDFGASKQLTATVMTQVGTAIGSFGYAPLEQMQGGEAYPASDLYSLGATCFHLLSGIHPWELWKKQGYGWVGSWRQHLQQPVSGELGQILDKLLQDEYHQRYQSGTEVLRDLTPLAPSPIPPTQPIAPTVTSPSPQIPVTQPFTPPVTSSQPKKSIPISLFVIPLIVLAFGGTVYWLSSVGSNNSLESAKLEPTSKSAEDYYQQGLLEQDNQKATEYFRQAAEIFAAQGNQGDAKRSQGLARYSLKDYQGAIAAYTEAININSNDFKSYNNRGLARSDLGDKKAAIEDYNQAIKIDPNFVLAYKNRGNTRSALGNKQAAIEDYNQAIKIDPNDANTYNNRGSARDDLGDKKAAIEDYNQAIKINPNYANAYFNRGNARDDLGDKKAAIEDYNQAIKINPNFALAYNNRGSVRSDLGDKKAAIEDYNQAIKINPNHANAYYNRGNARSALGNKQAAIEDYNQAANLYKQQGKESDYQDALNRAKKLEK
jgi:serine/threonine protein kinase